MTSRERVRAVLNHQIPDRVPNGLGACETAGLHLVAYDNLQKMLGVERKPPRLDTFMSPAYLKETFGRDIIFWGGAYDAQLVDKSASYEDVYKIVRDNIKIFSKGGNFIFSGVHNLPADVPEHHLKAMIDAYRDARDY